MRVSGKHNDLENVGPSPRHHTFFEMLGNFSFGDYFKKDAIRFAWDLLVVKLGLPVERLWFTVYQDDDEAERLWIETGAPADRVLRFGKKDNWWAMGDTGPCGPCSEIHYYWGDLAIQDKSGVNNTDEYLEIWNLVFMQYDQKASGELASLPAPSVDTGAGLERLASILQGKQNNYDTDAFSRIMDKIQQTLEESDAHRAENLYRYRAIADHARACTFMIGDGVTPGNEGRQYVLRMILRRAARFGLLIGFEGPFLAQIASVVVDEMGGHYSDLPGKRDYILQSITEEEERFHRTLRTGLRIMDELMATLRAKGETTIPGAEAFHLWDTYGFPVDLTRDIAQDNGLTIDEAAFAAALAEQKERSRAGAVEKIGRDVSHYAALLRRLQAEGAVSKKGVQHRIYDDLAEVATTVAAILINGEVTDSVSVGETAEIILPETNFYVESGGQVSDTGELYYFPEDLDEPVWTFSVTDTQRPVPGLIVHIGSVTSGSIQVGDPAEAVIDTERRWDIMRNHTATHVLQAVLRWRLGGHVNQAGSSVTPERLRFDFTHGAPLSREDLAEVEKRANEIVLANYAVNTRWTSHKQAIKEGITALFGEKYGDEVRVVSFGEEERISAELCGGTHVDSTAEIGSFRILTEGSVSAGVRRMEVTTGRFAETLIEERIGALEKVASLLHTRPAEAGQAVQSLLEQQSALQREVAQLKQKLARQESEALLARAVLMDGFSVLAVLVPADNVDTMRQMSDWFRAKLGSSVVAVGAVIDEKPLVVAAVTDDVQKRGMHAGNLVRDVAKIMGGGGGGRPNMAQAGGRDAEKLAEALQSVTAWVKANLK
jgi:alanyl-tRNA synthetase